MNKKILAVCIFGIILLGLFVYYLRHPLSAKLSINNHTIYVDVAVTPQEKALGLGGRPSMLADHGMIFLYDHQAQFDFWMKGMEFPLDFIWIAGDTVADISPNIPVLTEGKIPTVKPKVPVDKILELNAGSIAAYNITVGDHVTFMR
jgi:uncharacterized protein